MAYYRPLTHLRQVPVEADRAAILFIDTQNFNCHVDGAEHKGIRDGEHQYFWTRLETVMPNWVALRAACKQAGVEVMYTVIQSLTKDGRDRSLDYKISGFHVPPGCWDAKVIDCIAPGEDDIVIGKTSASVFMSTNIDYVLRNLGIKYLILVGCVTDQCVESAVRDACDANYLVTLVTDACATYSEVRQQGSQRALQGFCRQITTQELIQQLTATQSVHD